MGVPHSPALASYCAATLLATRMSKGSLSTIMCMSPGLGAAAGSITIFSTTFMLSSSAITPHTV